MQPNNALVLFLVVLEEKYKASKFTSSFSSSSFFFSASSMAGTPNTNLTEFRLSDSDLRREMEGNSTNFKRSILGYRDIDKVVRLQGSRRAWKNRSEIKTHRLVWNDTVSWTLLSAAVCYAPFWSVYQRNLFTLS